MNTHTLATDLLIKAEKISLQKNERVILDKVDLEIHKNEIVTLIGPNGAGKSTLLEIAIGVTKADSGKVYKKPGLKVAYVPQKLAVDPILPLSVKRLMSLTKKLSKTIITTALEKTKAGHLLNKMVSDLSGGELQRVLLARAIAQQADLLVLDEPAQGVDYAGQIDFYALIENIRDEQNCGILLISHDIHIVMSATDRVLCLNKHICCAGRPDKVSLDPAYRSLFGHANLDQIAIYNHKHDHEHDLDGSVVEVGESIGHIHTDSCSHSQTGTKNG